MISQLPPVLFVAVVLAGCAGHRAAPEPAGRLFQMLNPMTGEPMMQVDLEHAQSCRIVLSRVRLGLGNDAWSSLLSCTELDASSALRYQGTAVLVEDRIPVVVHAATIEVCRLFVENNSGTSRIALQIDSACAPKKQDP